MEAKENTEGLEDGALNQIIKSDFWIYWVKNFGDPENSFISSGEVPEQDGFVNAAEVFEAMGLPLKELSQIFVDRPWDHYRIPEDELPAAGREKQPTAKNYQCLKKCRPIKSDFEGWVKLANLVGKEIRLVHGDGEEIGNLIDTFFPSDKL